MAEEMEVRAEIQTIVLEHRRRYGYRRVTAELRRRGMVVNHKRVSRMMKEDNLLAVQPRAFVVTTDSRHELEVYLNLARRMKLTGINQLWVADITYIRLQTEFVYLAVILDGFSRKVVGWALGRTLMTPLPKAALEKAVAERQPPPGLVHHSDRGSQYASNEYVQVLQAHQMIPSMSRPANPYDNASCESFMKTLKREEIYAHDYVNLEHLRANVEEFIEHYRGVKQRLARYLGLPSSASDRIAFLGSAAEGINRFAEGMDWRPGDEVVSVTDEYPNALLPWLARSRQGVRLVAVDPAGAAEAAIAAAITDRTRAICVSHVSYLNGRRLQLDELRRIADDCGALLIVDASQSLGVLPVDVELCDVMVSCCYKFILGIHGVGIFYCSEAVLQRLTPTLVGWHSIEWPWKGMSFCVRVSSEPAATRICSRIRSMSVIISVTGCSTWMRVFISMK